jgi:hypothetical protein
VGDADQERLVQMMYELQPDLVVVDSLTSRGGWRWRRRFVPVSEGVGGVV